MSLPSPSAGAEVVVTGASSGIGTELARGLAARGHNLAVVARRRDRLEALASELRSEHGIEVTIYERDLGTVAEREGLMADLEISGREIAGLCNCAGFGTSGTFHKLPRDREREQVELNAVAVLELTHAALGPMVERAEGAILNVASIAAFQPLPRMATYAATKAFVQTFSEAVHEELRGSGVSCTALCPGPVETEWAEIADAQAVMIPGAKISAREVAKAGIEGMEQGKRSVVPGMVPAALAATGRYTPRTVLLPAFKLGSRWRSRRS